MLEPIFQNVILALESASERLMGIGHILKFSQDNTFELKGR